MPLHTRILIGLVVGVVGGYLSRLLFDDHPLLQSLTTYVTEPVGRLFLRLIFMVVIPLLFSALALGVAGIGDVRTLGRIGLKTFIYSLTVTGISVVIGLTLVTLFRPGEYLTPETRASLQQAMTTPSPPPPSASTDNPVLRVMVMIVPDNPIRAAAQGEMLAVMFFSLMVGIGIAMSPRAKVEPFLLVLEGLYEVVMRLIEIAMRMAPYAVAALLFTLTARFGASVVKPLLAYMAVVIGGLTLHLLVTYSVIVRYCSMRPGFFFRQISEVMTTAFSTSSSNATLPTALRVTQEKLGVPRDIASFVLTLGSTANQNGTALFEGVTILFLAQFYGVELTLASQALVVLVSVLAGIGTAGVPGGSLPLMVPILQSVGVPGEGIGIILGVDRILDMSRTVLNVTGDVTAAVYVAHSEGRLPPTPETEG